MARAFLLMEAMNEEERRDESLARTRFLRRIRKESNSLAMSEFLFRAHYRLSKRLFMELCSELRPLMSHGRRRTKLSVECKVLSALSFYATGTYQKPVGMSYLHGLSQPSVSNAVSEVTMALNNLNILKKYIRFPQTQEERNQIINGYYNKFGFPGVLGCIDGTHVAMVKPSDHEERFFNRKHFHSRNVQLICDSDLNILNVDASFGGASHDAFIWRQSDVNYHIQQLHGNGEIVWLLGDSGYPLRPWLLTPIVNTEPESPEEHYTNIHCKTRNTIERCIGVLKSRWRCLLGHRVLHYNHHTVAKIINACCVLHNIANRNRLPLPEFSEEELRSGEVQQELTNMQDESQMLESGRQQQTIIVERLWRNRHNM